MRVILASSPLLLTDSPLAGSPLRPQPQWSPLHLTRDRQPPCPLFEPHFWGKEVANPKLISLDKTSTLYLNSKHCIPVVGEGTILPMTLHWYGCGQEIATNLFPPNEDPQLSLY